MSVVNPTVKNNTLLIHPVLEGRIDPEFLDPTKNVKFLLNKLERAREHLARNRPFVMRAAEAGAYYVLCPQFAVILKQYGWDEFDQMSIPAVEVDYSDDEIVYMFWTNVRKAYSLIQVCREKGFTIHNAFERRPDRKIKFRPEETMERFSSQVDRYNEFLKSSSYNQLASSAGLKGQDLVRVQTSEPLPITGPVKPSKNQRRRNSTDKTVDSRQLILGL